jgi:hypothetical protein
MKTNLIVMPVQLQFIRNRTEGSVDNQAALWSFINRAEPWANPITQAAQRSQNHLREQMEQPLRLRGSSLTCRPQGAY